MTTLLKTIKTYGLSEFYFSLSVEDKEYLAKYSQYLICDPKKIISCSSNCDGCFMVTNGAQFLWATAANSIPDKKYDFAENLLKRALALSEDVDDIAWIHANLAQVYYERHKLNPTMTRQSIHHCHELIKMGYMKSWAQNLIEEMSVFQV